MAASISRDTSSSNTQFVSSFRKKGHGKSVQIPGTRPSLHNGQLLLSTGIPSLDHILGGGLAVGSVLLVEEDVYSSFARLMLKYFVAEGVVCGHYSFLSSMDCNVQSLLAELPFPVENTLSTGKTVPQPINTVLNPPSSSVASKTATIPEKPERSSLGNMEIAWRYQNLPQLKTELSMSSHVFGHFFDLTKTMPMETINKDKLWCYQSPSSQFDGLLEEIKRVIDISGCNLQASFKPISSPKNVLRISLLSLGSPLWGESGTTAEGNASMCQFLHSIRATLRKSLAVCLVTMPTHLYQPMYSRRIERLCDYVVRLQSFAGEDKSPAFKEYHGLFHVVQIPRINCLTNYALDTEDLAFKLKRKNFSIEKIHLPPDLSENVSRSQGEHFKTMKGCSSSNVSSPLDF
ncbi:elongator complex protein 4-like [Anneissia japonica]|uniref:elongator complex protein 4-like n=1 Tax=Anneissia japonica TaxID=1529436 RepID=UPI00142566B1|nr:elongator complex protein 4-like [Anneissia japonica]